VDRAIAKDETAARYINTSCSPVWRSLPTFVANDSQEQKGLFGVFRRGYFAVMQCKLSAICEMDFVELLAVLLRLPIITRIDRVYPSLYPSNRRALNTTSKVDPSCAMTAGPIPRPKIVAGTRIATMPKLT